jgi:NADPH-dependent 2,4-dienoyl-CoA reductase/sulfur reductase-like enzyme
MTSKSYTIFIDPITTENTCAVIGSGVMGLMTGIELAKRGKRVTIYSEMIP